MIRRAVEPGLVLALTVLTWAAVALDVGSPLQPLIVALFLLMAPGASVLLSTCSWSWPVRLTAVISTSLAMDLLLSSALLYAGWWSPTAVLAALSSVCLGAAAAHLVSLAGAARLLSRSAAS